MEGLNSSSFIYYQIRVWLNLAVTKLSYVGTIRKVCAPQSRSECSWPSGEFWTSNWEIAYREEASYEEAGPQDRQLRQEAEKDRQFPA